MKTTRILTTAILSLGIGTGVCAYAADPIPAQEPILKQELGEPLSGSISDREDTRKQRNPAKDHRSDQNAQVTLGGANYFVFGEVLKIDGEHYFVKDDNSGEEVRLLVNKDANMTCGAASASESASIGKQPGALD